MKALKRESAQKESKWRLALERFKQKSEAQSAQLSELREELKLSEQLRLEAEQKLAEQSNQNHGTYSTYASQVLAPCSCTGVTI